MPAVNTAQSAQILEQPVELVQSLDLVQTTICAVVSTVAFLRCLFPEDCFRTHYYDIEDPNYSYKDFMDAADDNSEMTVSHRKKVDHRFVPWDILVRGRSRGADKLLDWIELGMADALSHKYLMTMQLSIYDGEVSSLKRVEAYIIVFSYTKDSVEMHLQLSGVRGLPSPPGKTITSAKQALRYLVHRLANHIGGFPELSPRTIVNMHFTYNDSCPLLYEPPGFVMCQDQGLILQSNEGASVGTLNPGPHHVELRVFVKEREPSPLATVTLRGRASRMHPTNSTFTNEMETATREEMKQTNAGPTLAALHPIQDLLQEVSQLSNATAALDTQERGQLAAIDSMARLRFIRDDPQDTQILNVITPGVENRCGRIGLDDESSAFDGSSTQGTPSTAGCRRSARLALRSITNSPPQALVMLRPRKRSPMPENEQRTAKLRKVSKAKSPFNFTSKCSQE